jgi:hypothetical protein
MKNTYYFLADGVYSTRETTFSLESAHMENTYPEWHLLGLHNDKEMKNIHKQKYTFLSIMIYF